MHFTIPDILTPDQVAQARQLMETARFVDGRTTASGAASAVKRNLQVDLGDANRRELLELVAKALGRNETISGCAFPKAMVPPTFSRYEAGMEYGTHVDAPFLNDGRLRADISITVFLNDPAEYDGGELVLRIGEHDLKVKLPAGHGFLYPTTYLHRVAPVTRGARLVAVSWFESHIPDERQRLILWNLNGVKRTLEEERRNDDTSDVMRASLYNLIRLWWQP